MDPGGGLTAYSKPLISVGGRTLLGRTVDNCRAAGVRRILVVTGFNAELVSAEARRLSHGDIETVYNPHWRKRNGVSLHVCADLVDTDFFLMMSDHVFDPDILRWMTSARLHPGSVTLAVDRKIDSVFDLDDATKVRTANGRITAISKELDSYDAVDCGVFHCTPAIFDALEDAMDEDGDCSLSEGMSALGRRGRFYPFDIGRAWWQDVDTPDMMWNALALLQANQPRLERERQA